MTNPVETPLYAGYPTLSGFHSSSPVFFHSLDEARWWLRTHADPDFRDHGGDTDSLTLYYVDGPDDVRAAEELAGVGVPFDYPARVVEFGPRGSTRVTRC